METKGMKLEMVSNEGDKLVVALEPTELQSLDDAIASTKRGNQIGKVTKITIVATEMAME